MKHVVTLFQQAIDNNDLNALEQLCQEMKLVYEILAKENYKLNFIPALTIPYSSVSPALVTSIAQSGLEKFLGIKDLKTSSELLIKCYAHNNLSAGEALIADGVSITEKDRETQSYKYMTSSIRNVMEARLTLETMKKDLFNPKFFLISDPVKSALHNILVLDSMTLANFINEITDHQIANPFDAKQWQRLQTTLEKLLDEMQDDSARKHFKIYQLATYQHPDLPVAANQSLSHAQKTEIESKATAVISALLAKAPTLTGEQRQVLERYFQSKGQSTSIEENRIKVAAIALLDQFSSIYQHSITFPENLCAGLTQQQFPEATALFRQTCFALFTQQPISKPRFSKATTLQLTAFTTNSAIAANILDQGNRFNYESTIRFMRTISELLQDSRLNLTTRVALSQSLISDIQLASILAGVEEEHVLPFLALPGVIKLHHRKDDFLKYAMHQCSYAVTMALLNGHSNLHLESRHINILSKIRHEKSHRLMEKLTAAQLQHVTIDCLADAVEAQNVAMFEHLYNKCKQFPEASQFAFMAVANRIIECKSLFAIDIIIQDPRFTTEITDVFKEHLSYRSPLMVAASVGDQQILKKIVSLIPAPKDRNTHLKYISNIQNVLLTTARGGYDQCVSFLVNLLETAVRNLILDVSTNVIDEAFGNLNLDVSTNVFETAFMCENDNAVVIKILLASTLFDPNHTYLLNSALKSKNIKNIQLLFADNRILKPTIQYALMSAAKNDDVASAKILLATGKAELNQLSAYQFQNGSGTPMMVAVKKHKYEFVKAFITHPSINFALMDSDGESLLSPLILHAGNISDIIKQQIGLEAMISCILEADKNFLLPNLNIAIERLHFINRSIVGSSSSTAYDDNRELTAIIKLTHKIELHLLKQSLRSPSAAIKLLFTNQSLLRDLAIVTTNNDPRVNSESIIRAKVLLALSAIMTEIKNPTILVSHMLINSRLRECVQLQAEHELLNELINEMLTNKTHYSQFGRDERKTFLQRVLPFINNNTALATQCEYFISGESSKAPATVPVVVKPRIADEIAAIRESVAVSSSSSSSTSARAPILINILTQDTTARIHQIVKQAFDNLIQEPSITYSDLQTLSVILEETEPLVSEFLKQQTRRNTATQVLLRGNAEDLLNYLENPELMCKGEIKTDAQKALALMDLKVHIKKQLYYAMKQREPLLPAIAPPATEPPPSQAHLISQLSSIIVPDNLPPSIDDDNAQEEAKPERIAQLS